MKRILMLFCILILFVFVGCGTKDNDTSSEETDVIEMDFMAQLQMPESGQEVAIMMVLLFIE